MSITGPLILAVLVVGAWCEVRYQRRLALGRMRDEFAVAVRVAMEQIGSALVPALDQLAAAVVPTMQAFIRLGEAITVAFPVEERDEG